MRSRIVLKWYKVYQKYVLVFYFLQKLKPEAPFRQSDKKICAFSILNEETVKVKQSRYRPGVAQRVPVS